MGLEPKVVTAAVVVGALSIAAAIVGAQFVPHYQLVLGGGPEHPFVWRLNTTTGSIESCAFMPDTNPFDKIAPPIAGESQAQALNMLMRCSGDPAP
jgi:hypothetical protein